MTKRRSGIRFVGNSPELDEEFRKMLESLRKAGDENEPVTLFNYHEKHPERAWSLMLPEAIREFYPPEIAEKLIAARADIVTAFNYHEKYPEESERLRRWFCSSGKQDRCRRPARNSRTGKRKKRRAISASGRQKPGSPQR